MCRHFYQSAFTRNDVTRNFDLVFLSVLLGKLVYADNNQLIAEMLGGYMAGVTVSGVLWAVFQNNAGGAWDNAKKII
jgi:Na+/H+-translocating membrane pyrophosphatase